MDRQVMDNDIKPLILEIMAEIGEQFENDVIPQYKESKIFASSLDPIIAKYQHFNDTRLYNFYRTLRNILIMIYDNDSFYGDDARIALRALANNPALNDFRG
jgi:hypothetical protein